MPEITPPNPADAGLEINIRFVRSRNVLLARGEFGDLFVDYYPDPPFYVRPALGPR